MKRFIDIGTQTGNTEGEVKEFCFYCTVLDKFETFSGECVFSSINEFKEYYEGNHLQRYIRLIPDNFNRE